MPSDRPHRHPWALALPLLVAACSSGGGGGSGPNEPTLGSVVVTPSSQTIFTLAPGNTVTLTAAAKDQDGDPIASPGTITWTSGNTAVATVSPAGLVTAAGAGTTQITASATVGGVTKSGSATITASVAPSAATVNAQLVGSQPSWVPGTVDVSAGGQVTWSVGAVAHNISFTGAGAPANVPDWQDGAEGRTFPTPGTYPYVCTIHAGMSGSVRVH